MTAEEELEKLRAKLVASERLGDGFKDRRRALEVRIAELEREADRD